MTANTVDPPVTAQVLATAELSDLIYFTFSAEHWTG
jgi:hypothetical protein